PLATGFPPVERALTQPNGLLAVGGTLTSVRLLAAYRLGIFPWYGANQPILWWSPDPRLVLFPNEFKASHSMRRSFRRAAYRVSFDQAFRQVLQKCAEPRPGQDGTWLSTEMQEAYTELHHQGWAHSVEVWEDSELVGGVYGIAIGAAFFGESMFSRRDDTSKIALWYLVRHLQAWGFEIVDCQVRTDHLVSLGAREISRTDFSAALNQACPKVVHAPWQTTLAPQN
ncbi:MAG: leucyl/phenylalanyl-tRNA--protein transferase, partial [Gammaproteobacteria bacterium]|nr:leucyl/phenylalanyl-tRNA--protein transferase [Gammaproteobacteria bacterium]